MTKPTVDPKFIVNLKGKEFVTYEGLLDMGHQVGLKSIETSLIQVPSEANGNIAIATARITTEDDRIFEEIGDAGPLSVNNMIRPHSIRMAFTRAKARALRDLTNIGMTAVEELGGDDNHQQQPRQYKQQPRPVQQQPQRPQQQGPNHQCSSCGVQTNANVAAFSSSKFGKILCRDCQNKARG